MFKYNHQNIFYSLIIPQLLVLTSLMVVISYLTPQWIQSNIEQTSISTAQQRADEYKEVRKYYNNIIEKADEVSLPATFIHDLSDMFSSKHLELHLYSPYSFPNQKGRLPDEFQQAAWDYLNKNPNEQFIEVNKTTNILRFAIADKLETANCAHCDNTRADSPKVDWKKGDLVGILEVSIDINEAMASGKILTQRILFACFIAAIIILAMTLLFTKGIFSVMSNLTQSMSNLTQSRHKLASDHLQPPISGEDQKNESGEIASVTEQLRKNLLDKGEYEQKVIQLEFVRSELEKSRLTEELKQQKFALDQHAIVAITDIRGNITFVNDKFVEISGYSKDELMGKNHRLLNSGTHEKDIFREMYLTISKGKVWKGDLCNKAKSGELYWVDTTIVPTMKDGKPETYVAIRNDITERKNAEVALIKAKKIAESAVKAKSAFLATMSHEIRTPMNGILGMLGLLKRSQLSDEQNRKLDIALSNAQSLLTLINDILDFSKIDAGKLELEELDFDIRKTLEEMTETIAYRAQEKGVELILDASKIHGVYVRGDPSRFRQILMNLAGNAIKFTDSGEIVIRAEIQEQDNQHWLFTCTVSDTGIGIPDDKIPELFNSFSQIDASTTRKFGGTGLGLAIVKQLCELMGGSIQAKSKYGEGSCFSFTLKFAKSEQKALPAPQVSLKALHILIAEGNATNRELLKEELDNWGIKSTLANSAEQALSICKEVYHSDTRQLFDAAILDMHLPDMDGIELGKIIKESPNFQSMPLILMTSLVHPGDKESFADLGFQAYFTKPYTSSDLLDALTMISSGGKVSGQAESFVKNHCLTSQTKEDNKRLEWPTNARILVVDDNQVNIEVAQGMLEELKLYSDQASNGIEALQMLKQSRKDQPYSIVLMDCQMPEMDGYEATDAIRNGKAGDLYRSIPIIALTANAMKGDDEKCLASGMNDYLTKPIEPELLEEKLYDWMVTKNASKEEDTPSESPATQIETSVPVWDKDAALKQASGKSERLEKFIHMYLDDIPGQLEQLNNAISNQNVDFTKDLAHLIKGISGNLGIKRVAQISSELERAALLKNLENIDEIWTQLTTECEEARKSLQEYVGKN